MIGTLDRVIDLFGVPWSNLDLPGLRAFLDDAGEEGVTWEAKADDERGQLGADAIRKAACGLANQIGGYVIVGANWDKKAREWRLPGVELPGDEPELWLSKAIRRLTPAPRHEPKAWPLDGGRTAAVVLIEPVDEPPCMTPRGRVYERVSGETVPVQDPALLDGLFRRGQQARERAEKFAERAAERALDAPRWQDDVSVAIAVALASVGRTTDDISSRLFVPSFRDALTAAVERFVDKQPDSVETWQEQDALTAFAHFEERMVLHMGGVGAHRQEQTTWFVQATWDGTVAAAAAFTVEAVRDLAGMEKVVLPGWREVVPLVERLGGYGPAHLSVCVHATQEYESPLNLPPLPHRDAPEMPLPPQGTIFRQLREERTWMGRHLAVEPPSTDTLGSLQRELQRAAGIESFEPENEPSAPA